MREISESMTGLKMTNGKRMLSKGSGSYKLQNSLPWDVLDAERLHEFKKQIKENSTEGH